MKYADSHVLKKKFFCAAQPLENYGLQRNAEKIRF